MLDAIQSVIRCTASNDAVPILTHVAIIDGRMHAFNGRMYACATIESNPYELDDICVRADMLLAALRALGDDTKAKAEVDMEHGTLRFTSKRYRARVPVRPTEDFYIQELPSHRKAAKIEYNLSDVLNTLRPIVGDNPALPWSHGFLIEEKYIAATNATIMAKVNASTAIKPTIITAEFAAEIIAQGVNVTRLHSENGRATAWFENGVVVSSVIIDGVWPRSFETIIDPLVRGAKFTSIPAGFDEALESIVPFSSDNKNANVTMNADKMELVSSEIASASIVVDGLRAPSESSFNVNQLRCVLGLAKEWDLSKFPHVPFRDKERGIIGGVAGVRV